LAKKEIKQQFDSKWVEEALANFEDLYPGLVDKIAIISSQHQVRLSIFPQTTSGEATSSTSKIS